jgi:hypothetical protein
VKTKNKKSKGKSRPKLTTLIKLLDLNNINFSIAREKRKDRRGRPPLDPQAMIKIFIMLIFKGFSEQEWKHSCINTLSGADCVDLLVQHHVMPPFQISNGRSMRIS